jgi:hypothetical protein
LNRREALQGTGAFTVPAILVIGGSMLTLALTSAGGYRPEAARAAPTVTATVTVPAPSPARTTVVARPNSSPTPAATIVAAQDTRTQTVSAAGERPGPGAASGPSPQPTSPPSRCGVGLTVLALHACLKLGGSR